MKIKNGLGVISLLVSIGLGCLILVNYLNKPKVALIEIQKVYDSFELKKELEKKFKNTQSQRKKIIDSLELDLKLLYSSLNTDGGKNVERTETFNLKKNYYLQKKQMNEEDNLALSQQYDKEILTQLNQYVKDYGKLNKYTYIFGTDGNGSIMYANEKEDISDQIILYINERYKGVK